MLILDVNLAAVALAGFLGAVAMALTTLFFHAIRVPVVDVGRLIATKLLRYHSHGTRFGLLLHMATGVVLALVYALVAPLFPGPAWLHGLGYGILLWLLMMLVILPLMGDGLFGRRNREAQMIPSALVVHVVYGLVLGVGAQL
ncbi:MAG: hypothetical protein HYU75_13535 [Betaproteobacteria bacterium]|nr:hypothetical protein [Betaproteobacteria bacterium]